MMKLNGCEKVYLYEFDGHDHNNMPGPAHTVTKRFIQAIANGRPLPER